METKVATRYWAIRSPRGTIQIAIACKKPDIYRHAVAAFGHLTKSGAWRGLYRRGWRIIPAIVVEAKQDWFVIAQKSAA